MDEGCFVRVDFYVLFFMVWFVFVGGWKLS